MAALIDLLAREHGDPEFDLLEILSSQGDWDSSVREALDLLADRRQMHLWQGAFCVVYWAPPESLPSPRMGVVARLYWCLLSDGFLVGDEDENLVWSIATDLKGVGYESDWEPLADPEVRKHLSEMRSEY